MSKVKERLFNFSKSIETNPNRQLISDSFTDIHKGDRTSSNLGYLGRKQYKQFLGYLVLNNERDKINQNFPEKIEEMPKSTYDAFIYGNSYLRKINQLCLAPLLEMIPKAYQVIDPYWEIDKGNKFYSEVVISGDGIDKLIQSFQLSKPFKIIRNKLEAIPSLRDLEENDVANGVYSIRERIKTFGLHQCPEDLFELGLKINMNTPDALFGSVLFALLYINSSLQCFDQILFQKFTSDKLISLNENNVYNILHIGSNALSKTYELSCSQPVLFCGDILHIDLPMHENNIKDFCIIENLKISFSQDFGQEFKVGLRGTDDNFSFYGNLIENITV